MFFRRPFRSSEIPLIKSYKLRQRSRHPEYQPAYRRASRVIVVVQGFDAVFVGGQQVFEHLFHGNFVAFKFARVVGGVGGNRLINEFLHHANKFQIAFVARKLPQSFVGVFQGFKLRYDLFQNTVF